jgi:hypothetical protein
LLLRLLLRLGLLMRLLLLLLLLLFGQRSINSESVPQGKTQSLRSIEVSIPTADTRPLLLPLLNRP